jgi:hypothetical protein
MKSVKVIKLKKDYITSLKAIIVWLALMAIATQISLVLLYSIFLGFNIIIENNYDCRDPALISYYPDEQVKRLRQDEFVSAYGVGTKKEVFDLYYEFAEAGSIYEPFVETRSRSFEGKYYGVSSQGFRKTSADTAWPPVKGKKVVFFFGGSTCFHVGPWWTGVAPAFQRELARAGKSDYLVYNFGRSSYFSTQERILFEQLLLEGSRPDVAIFLDGLNDLQIESGVPLATPFIASLYNRATEENKHRYFSHHQRLFFAKLSEAWAWSGPMVFLSNLKNLSAQNAYKPFDENGKASPRFAAAASPEKILAAIERLISNWRMIDRLAQEYGVKTAFIIQPVPVFDYELKYHRFVPTEWPSSMANVAAGYPLLKQRCATEKQLAVLDLGDLQKGSMKNLYIDSCHYTAEFSEIIAQRILTYYVDKK